MTEPPKAAKFSVRKYGPKLYSCELGFPGQGGLICVPNAQLMVEASAGAGDAARTAAAKTRRAVSFTILPIGDLASCNPFSRCLKRITFLMQGTGQHDRRWFS